MTMGRPENRVAAARFLSRAGSEAAFYIGIWGKAAYELDAGPRELAVVMFSLSAAYILGSLVGGVLIDRLGPRRVLAAAEVLFVPATIAVVAAHSIPQLAALTALWAFAGAPVITAGASFAPFIAKGEGDLARTNALIEGAGSAAFVAGPAAGALIARFAHVNWVFALDAATSLAAAALVWTLPVSRSAPATEGGRRRIFGGIAEGLAVSYSIRAIRYYVLAGTVVWLGFGAFGALEPLFFRDVVGTGIETLGWVNTVFGLGMLTGAALLRRLPPRFVSARWLTVVLALTGLGTVMYVGSPYVWLIAAGAAAWGVIVGVLEPLLRTLLHRDSPPGLVGRIVGTAEVHQRGGELLPLAFAPALAAAFGVQPTLIAGGLAVTVAAVIAMPEAVAIDRAHPPGEKPTPPEAFLPSDEPVSPTP